MNEKEKLFVRYYALTGNPREAAARAGARLLPERWGLKLLAREEIRRAIADLTAREDLPETGICGLRRIAFGSTADAMRLLWMEQPPAPEQLEKMDLFMVSEIKRPKAGGLEIKFYDRLKALERLCEWQAGGDEDAALPFYQALSEGAKRLKGVEEL